jgi:hypothetical protein
VKFWPGEVVKIPENAYKYGLGTLTLAVTFAWRDHDDWYWVEGDEIRWDGTRGERRTVLVRSSALRRLERA